jgi:TIR domain
MAQVSRIFISHASADKPLVDPFVTTVIQLGCEVPKESIFYSSGEDTGVPSGYTLNDYIKSQMESVSLVVAIISPAFQTRPFCIAELGAAWSQVGKLFPIAIPGLERTDMQGVLTGLAVRYLSDSAALDELHDQICNLLGTNPGAKT